MLVDEVLAPWLGRYRRSDAALSYTCGSFGTLSATDRHGDALKLVSMSQVWLCFGAVRIQLGRFCIAELSVAAWLCDSIMQQVTTAAQLARRGQ